VCHLSLPWSIPVYFLDSTYELPCKRLWSTVTLIDSISIIRFLPGTCQCLHFALLLFFILFLDASSNVSTPPSFFPLDFHTTAAYPAFKLPLAHCSQLTFIFSSCRHLLYLYLLFNPSCFRMFLYPFCRLMIHFLTCLKCEKLW